MYNNDIKIRYIEEKMATTSMPKGYLKRQFDKIEVFEKRLNKDVCDFTKYEIIDLYKTLNMSSIGSLVVLNSHLALYVQWCLQQNLVFDCQNHFSEINNTILASCINTIVTQNSIITREVLFEWLIKFRNPSDAFIMLALFEGISGKEYCEIAQLKMSDFDGNRVKLCTGRELDVSPELLSLAEQSNETKIYYSNSGDGKKTMPLLNEDLIVKGYPNIQTDDVFQQSRRIYNRVKRNFDALGVSKYMKPKSIIESGKIDYINSRCKKLGITAEEFISTKEYTDEFKYRFEFDVSRNKAMFIRKYGEYLV